MYKIDEESDDILAEKPGKAQYLLNDCIYLLRIEGEEQSHSCIYWAYWQVSPFTSSPDRQGQAILSNLRERRENEWIHKTRLAALRILQGFHPAATATRRIQDDIHEL